LFGTSTEIAARRALERRVDDVGARVDRHVLMDVGCGVGRIRGASLHRYRSAAAAVSVTEAVVLPPPVLFPAALTAVVALVADDLCVLAVLSDRIGGCDAGNRDGCDRGEGGYRTNDAH
jgi:hypothetical protein